MRFGDWLMFLAWVGALLSLRYVVVPSLKRRFSPPSVPLAWSQAARRFSIDFIHVRRGWSWVVSGRVPISPGRDVLLEAEPLKKRGWSLIFDDYMQRSALVRESVDVTGRVTIDARELIPKSLIVRGRSRSAAEARKTKREELGAPTSELDAFHDAVEILGDSTTIAALLDRHTRSVLKVSMFDLGYVVENGYVVLSGRNIETSRPFVEAMIARVQELVAALSIEEARVLPRLEKIAAEEASPEVRAHALTVLARAFPKARTRHIFEKAREDVSPLVRVRALEGLKDPELADIAAVLRDPGTSYELMIDAIRVALRHHPRPHVEACLIELFDGARGQEGPLRIALIESLGRLKSERCASSFLALLAERDPGTRESAARALGWLGATRFEADLFPLLEDDDEEVADAAVFALGACGTIAAIAPLRAADDHLEVEDAIRRIIGRHGAPRAGGLAIVGDANNQSGALSLSAGGELSEVPEPRDP